MREEFPFIGDEVYVVEHIIGHRGKKSNRRYLVKWEGYEETKNSWVHRRDFSDKATYQQYEQQLIKESAVREARK